MLCQRPQGAAACNRLPRGALPRNRVMLVFAALSSRKMSLQGSSPPWVRFQRRRALATSSRSCSAARSVFFLCQSHVHEHVVNGGQRALQAQGLTQFGQGHIGLALQVLANGDAMLRDD